MATLQLSAAVRSYPKVSVTKAERLQGDRILGTSALCPAPTNLDRYGRPSCMDSLMRQSAGCACVSDRLNAEMRSGFRPSYISSGLVATVQQDPAFARLNSVNIQPSSVIVNNGTPMNLRMMSPQNLPARTNISLKTASGRCCR